MPMMETPGWGRPAKAALRALVIGVAGVAAIAPLADVTASVPVPALAPQPDGPRSEPPEVEARVALGPGGRDIRLAGDLTEGVAARVATLLKANPGVERIHLTSDGGLVDEAEAIGALVAERGLATYVPDACASACTLVFVRGRVRYLVTGAQLGFHAPYELGAGGRMEAVDPGAERAAYLAAGLTADFVARTMTVAPEDIWIPEPARLREAGVVTEMVGSDRFPDSTLDADPSLPAARAEILRNFPILSAADPAAVDEAASWYRDGYLAGRTEAEAIAGLHQRGSAALRRRFRATDEATILALGQVVLTSAAVADACAALAEGDLVTLDETLKRARPGSPGLAPLLARNAPDAGIAAGARANRSRTAQAKHRLVPPICAGPLAAVRRALGRAPHEAALALRTILLGDPPATIASAALP
ncbi:hypothetical protein MKL09_24535 [Methylobacterium sp. J-048]|uniref:COG3904 family protein n=1 Tax=Methylobacterium sp. J-048 TaxID=2836635 RepID=UPI001FB96DCB|nr:hypothetical protein [Methylobacterium sp. J-048]MCJ2059696.1 hypothetical protein [Methylobacterium sp. J-048]